jgi:hypothetical protein
MNNGSIKSDTLLFTVCGTALAIVAGVDPQDVVRTVIHAAIGAVVSFSVSLLLKWVIEKVRK